MAQSKTAEAIGSGTPDPVLNQSTTAPVPGPVVSNKPPPGQRGPKGMQPRQSFSRVNTGAPPVPDAGLSAQKAAPIRGMEFLPAKTAGAEVRMTTMMKRPDLTDLVKEALAGTVSKADINAEVARLSRGLGEEKTASAEVDVDHISTEAVEKLASAVGYIADQLQKEAETQEPGKGPGALTVLEATSSDQNVDAGETGQASSGNQPPKTPPTQTEEVQTGKANTGLETNDAMMHPPQPEEPITNEKASIAPQKTASVKRVAEILQKTKGKDKEASALVSYIRKLAEDANNPAKISGGGTHDAAKSPDGVSASGEGKPPVPSDVSKQEKLVSSNEAATDYTKRDAKADPKSDVNQVLDENAQTSSTDKVLDKVLDHTDEAGAKISSIRTGTIKTAAARALLSKLVKSAEGSNGSSDKKDNNGSYKDMKKKEKNSQGMSGAAPATPEAASGFNAGSI